MNNGEVQVRWPEQEGKVGVSAQAPFGIKLDPKGIENPTRITPKPVSRVPPELAAKPFAMQAKYDSQRELHNKNVDAKRDEQIKKFSPTFAPGLKDAGRKLKENFGNFKNLFGNKEKKGQPKGDSKTKPQRK
ncbi:hypothetical protein HYY75_02965 [bacterium]|nr:hypothetical protein [bacterium]